MLKEVLRWFRSLSQVVSIQRVKIYLVLFVAIVIVYTVLFHQFYPLLENEEISWIDALLFVIETLTTTGYGEFLPFENELTSLFTVVMMATGVVMIFMVVPLILTPFLYRLVRDTPPRRTSRALEGHVVIIGFDDMVRSLLESLQVGDLPIVIVEEDEEIAMRSYNRYRGQVQVIWGDPILAATRTAASLESARYVVVVGDERATANTILGIRGSTDAEVIAVVDDPGFDRYLRYAGAEYVFSPKHSTGRMLARFGIFAADFGSINEYLDPGVPVDREASRGDGLWLVKAPVLRGSRAIDRTIREIGFYERYGVEPLILWRTGSFLLLPSEDEVIDGSSMLFLLGRAEEIAIAIERELRSEVEIERTAVIAGFGDVGSAAWHELASRGIRCTVIDPQEHGDMDVVVGNAEDERVLKRSGIEDAQLLVAAVNDDAVNIFTTLMARNLNPSLRIVARANHVGAVNRLYRAGADFVALQPTIGGQVIAGILLADRIRILLDLPNGQRVVQRRWMRAAARTVRWLEWRSGARVVGIERAGRVYLRPDPAYAFQEGDQVMLIGGVKELRHCIRLM
jgi:Trk K+ transport system NAD-binding subunit